MINFKDGTAQARQQVIAGRTWLSVHMMQGGEAKQISQPQKHFLVIKGERVTDEHTSEVGLIMELSDQHKFSFFLLNCINTEETDNGYEFTWSMLG